MSEQREAPEIVEYGPFTHPDFQHVVSSRYSFEETLERLRRAIADEELWLIHEIDPQMLARRDGLAIPPARQLLFFHPRYLKRVLATTPDALIEAPLKLVVMEAPDSSVSVRHLDVAVHLARYAGLGALGDELVDAFARLMASVDR